MKRSVEGTALAYVSMLLSAIALGAVLTIAFVVRGGLALLAGAASPLVSAIGVLLVVGATAAALLLSLRWLPVLQLTSRDRRPAMAARLATLRRALVVVVVGTPIVLVVAIGVFLPGWHALPLSDPGVDAALDAVTSWYVFGPAAAIAVGCLLLGLLALLLRGFTRRFSADTRRRSAALAVGVAIVALAPIGLLTLLSSPGLGIIVAVVLSVGPIVFVVVGACGVLAIWLGLLPDRAGGPALAAAGLVIAAIGLGQAHPAIVFACVAGAALVWDVSTFGLGVTAELGHRPETRRLELVHGVVAIGVGVVAVLVAIGLETLRTGPFADVGGGAAVAIVALGALILLVPLRG